MDTGNYLSDIPKKKEKNFLWREFSIDLYRLILLV